MRRFQFTPIVQMVPERSHLSLHRNVGQHGAVSFPPATKGSSIFRRDTVPPPVQPCAHLLLRPRLGDCPSLHTSFALAPWNSEPMNLGKTARVLFLPTSPEM